MGNASTAKRRKERVNVKSVKNDGKDIKIKLQIVCDKFKKPMNVEFDFDAQNEDAQSVAMEMTRDLELPSKFTKMVEKAIKSAIAKPNKYQTQNLNKSVDKSINNKTKIVQKSNKKLKE